VPLGVTIENITLDAAARRRVINGVASNLKEYYVTPDVGQKMTDAVQAHAKNGDYNAITSGDVFAARLTKDLRDVSHDIHLGVSYNPYKTPPPPSDQHGPSPEEQERFHKELARNNCMWEKAEVRERNVGYIRFDAFMDPDYCGPTVVAAMDFLAHTDALTIDLRGNGGWRSQVVSKLLIP
jgi:hypothetical protein